MIYRIYSADVANKVLDKLEQLGVDFKIWDYDLGGDSMEIGVERRDLDLIEEFPYLKQPKDRE